jgi:uridine phosphorylase
MPLNQPYPILEYDPEREAILNPAMLTEPKFPPSTRAVACFFQDVLQGLAQEGRLREVHRLGSEIGPNLVYQMEEQGESLLVFHPGVGAPLAAGFLEEMIALGGRKFIACGGCGVLRAEIAAGHPVILVAAVRDEGTSYHYLPPAREAAPSPEAVAALEAACRQLNVEYRLGKTWTTDAFYRETPARRELRLQEGCDVVEMEAAAFFAAAAFRGVQFGQVVYGGDLVIPEGWDYRGWNNRSDSRRLMFDLAVQAVLKL